MLTKTKPATDLSERDIIVLSAIFARSNLGMALPKPAEVARLRWAKDLSFAAAVMCLNQEFMETDEHKAMFMGEAMEWVDDLRSRSKDYLRRVHNDIFLLYFPEA